MLSPLKKRCCFIMMIATFLMFFSVGSLLASGDVGDITINVPPSAPKGSTIFCDVTMNMGTEVMGSYDVTFTFDQTVLQIAEILGGTTSEFSATPDYSDMATANTTGNIHIVGYQGSIAAPTGQVSFFRIKFNVVGDTGTSSMLSMIDTSILNPNSVGISHLVWDAWISVDSGGAISGTIYKSDGVTPITGKSIQVNIVSSAPCNSWPNTVDSTYTATENGTFWISGLPAGTYYLKTWNNGTPYLDEWWANSASSTDCLDAELVIVTEGMITPGTDFQLDDGATISGTVFQSDGTTPITDATINLHVYSGNPCGSINQVNYGFSDTGDGTYTVGGLSTGNYYLIADNMNQSNYINAWWAESGSDANCTFAQTIPLTVGDNITGKNFQLSSGGAISGKLFHADGTTPITGVSIDVSAYTGDPCGSYQNVMGRGSDTNTGDYLISGIPPGTYTLKTWNNGAPYLDKWWGPSSSSIHCADAGTVTVTAGNTASDNDFELDSSATISGILYQSDGATPIIGQQMNIHLMSGDPCLSPQYIQNASYDTGTGNYTVGGIAPGTYYLWTNNMNQSNYVNEWWAESGSIFDCNGARAIIVAGTESITGMNFQLQTGAIVTGTVYQSNGTTPITGVQINVPIYSGNPCGSYQHITSSQTDSTNGTYSITGVPAGTYYLRSDNMNQSSYLNEWWASPNSVVDCNSAQSFAVNTGQTYNGKNFQLETGGSISGHALQTDSQPIPDLHVYAVDQVTGAWMAGANTDQDGSYSLKGLPSGFYNVRSCAACSSLNYVDEWYDNVYDQVNATAVSVTAPNDTPNIDFSLLTGGIISGNVVDKLEQPIADVYVHAYSSKCWANPVVGSSTDVNGNYSFRVPQGNYYVWANASSPTPRDYVNKWWTNTDGTIDCNQAEFVSVTLSQTTPDINFLLETGGTVSGTVFKSDGTTPVTDVQIHVTVYSGDPCGSLQVVKSSPTDSTDGTFIISGVPAGTYYLKAHVSETIYQGEWWAYPSSSVDCNKAQTITINAEQTLTEKDFQLNTGAIMTGTVRNDTDGQPVESVEVCGWPYPGGQGGQCATTLSDGTYKINGLPTGYLKVEAKGAGFLTEYYDNSYDPNWDKAVWAPAGQTTANINFSMGKYGSLSGTVYQGNGTTPLDNVCVDVYQHLCATNPFASAQTDTNGSYVIENLPPQAYYIKTRSNCTQPLPYDDPWWNGSGGVTYCDQATPVSVTSAQNTGGIDFILNQSKATYPGPSFSSAGVFSEKYADNSSGTIFYAFIDGPSLEDVVSLTATGPSGTFNLDLSQINVFIQLGNIYIASTESIVSDGVYTFTVTDSLGRTATVERNFAYNNTVPQVDSETMKVEGMGNQAYVGTATPTFTWGPVAGTGYYYQVFIYDYDGKAIWYTETTDGTSITVPEGYLQPDTPYRWWVRVGDTPEVGQRGQNRHMSDTLYFYTGTKGLPDLTTRSLLSYTSPDNGWANWFGISHTHLAPWDIDRYNVTGPNSTVYNFNGRVYLLWHPVFYHCWSPGPAPTPSGNYNFDLVDKDLDSDTRTSSFTYNPASPVPEESRVPAPNAYVYTKTPTFSWSPPNPDKTYYYNLRIYDYERRVHWYASSNTTETSVTLPDTFKAPPGSYKWEIRTYTEPEGRNGAYSSVRTFTIPPLSETDYTLPQGVADVRSYRLFTVPYYMSGMDFLKAMKAILGPYDPTHWRVFALINGTNSEINSEDFKSLAIVPSMGFWIITLYENTVSFEGALCPQDVSYKRSLPIGWQTISLPWNEGSVNLGDITVSDGTNTYHLTDNDNTLTQTVIWDYTGNGPELYSYYEKRSDPNYSLVNRTAYLIKVLAPNVVITIPPPGASGVNARVIASAAERSELDTNEPPPAFLCELGQNIRASSERALLPLPPGTRVTRPECSDCPGNPAVLRLDNVNFDSETPCLCTATEKIIVGEKDPVKIKEGADVIFQAPIVNLKSGFSTDPRATVRIKQN